MAAVPVTCVRLTTSMHTSQMVRKTSTFMIVPMGRAERGFPSLRSSRFQISCAVFISLNLYLKACKIFECVNQGKEAIFVAKQGGKIDYELLAMGSLQEVRHVFARIVFDTIYPLDLGHD